MPDLNSWRKRRFTPAWGDNRNEPEPCVVVFSPPTVGWMSRWREIAISAPRMGGDFAARLQEGEGLAEQVDEWTGNLDSFRRELLDELVCSVEGLTEEGKSISREKALDFILENEGLREEVFHAIIAEGTVSADQGKDSE